MVVESHGVEQSAGFELLSCFPRQSVSAKAYEERGTVSWPP